MNQLLVSYQRYLLSRKRTLLVAVCGAFCLAATGRYLWLVAGPASWEPRFACSASYFDCGEVPTNRTVTRKFTIENTGRKPLQILEAVPGCGGCLTVDVSKKEIAPGDVTVVKAVLDTTKLKKGSFRKALLLKTNDPNLPKVILYIQGTAV